MCKALVKQGKLRPNGCLGYRLVPLVLALLACSPEGPGPAASETGESGGVDCPAPSEPLCLEGRCWLREEGWTMRAEAVNYDAIAEGLEAGELAPVEWPGAECYAGEAATICVVVTDCGSELVGRPLAELAWDPAGCEASGAWDFTVVDSLGCLGVFDGPNVAVRLR